MQRKISLLYVEDDVQARELLERLLKLKFPDVTLYVASDGEEGLGLYLDHRPDLVLTDISMPVLDGFEMSKRIRNVDPKAFIIALTAYRDRAYYADSEMQFDLFVEKPVQIKILVEKIREAMATL